MFSFSSFVCSKVDFKLSTLSKLDNMFFIAKLHWSISNASIIFEICIEYAISFNLLSSFLFINISGISANNGLHFILLINLISLSKSSNSSIKRTSTEPDSNKICASNYDFVTAKSKLFESFNFNCFIFLSSEPNNNKCFLGPVVILSLCMYDFILSLNSAGFIGFKI